MLFGQVAQQHRHIHPAQAGLRQMPPQHRHQPRPGQEVFALALRLAGLRGGGCFIQWRQRGCRFITLRRGFDGLRFHQPSVFHAQAGVLRLGRRFGACRRNGRRLGLWQGHLHSQVQPLFSLNPLVSEPVLFPRT
ncbi:hypothetical protein [Vitreoscilla filiformis]|uniref:hypothetical protein n=1 Tax=Vitreoscilla filiformis TaxID=63 RepID=UPI0012FD2A80|nr:hypothetical protein [Vitreoscilla filiformis]